MMTNLSKWMLYISSYCIVYVFLLGVSVFNGWKSVKTIESKSIAEKASLIFSENKFVWCGLVILIAFSLFYVRQFMRQRNNTRIKKKVEENALRSLKAKKQAQPAQDQPKPQKSKKRGDIEL